MSGHLDVWGQGTSWGAALWKWADWVEADLLVGRSVDLVSELQWWTAPRKDFLRTILTRIKWQSKKKYSVYKRIVFYWSLTSQTTDRSNQRRKNKTRDWHDKNKGGECLMCPIIKIRTVQTFSFSFLSCIYSGCNWRHSSISWTRNDVFFVFF